MAGRGRPRGPEAVTVRVLMTQRDRLNALRKQGESTHDVVERLIQAYLAKRPKTLARMESVLAGGNGEAKTAGKKKPGKKKGAKKKAGKKKSVKKS